MNTRGRGRRARNSRAFQGNNRQESWNANPATPQYYWPGHYEQHYAPNPYFVPSEYHISRQRPFTHQYYSPYAWENQGMGQLAEQQYYIPVYHQRELTNPESRREDQAARLTIPRVEENALESVDSKQIPDAHSEAGKNDRQEQEKANRTKARRERAWKKVRSDSHNPDTPFVTQGPSESEGSSTLISLHEQREAIRRTQMIEGAVEEQERLRLELQKLRNELDALSEQVKYLRLKQDPDDQTATKRINITGLSDPDSNTKIC